MMVCDLSHHYYRAKLHLNQMSELYIRFVILAVNVLEDLEVLTVIFLKCALILPPTSTPAVQVEFCIQVQDQLIKDRYNVFLFKDLL